MTTNYRRGRDFEYRVRKWYESQGWYIVRSAGSKGAADLMMLRMDDDYPHPTVTMIQCKLGRISAGERKAFRELGAKLGCGAMVAMPLKKRAEKGSQPFLAEPA